MKTILLISNNSCQPIEFTSNDELSKCWDLKHAKYFYEEYSLPCFKNKKLGCNISHKININFNNQVIYTHESSNWIQCDIVPLGNSTSKQQASLKKIFKHQYNQSHINALYRKHNLLSD